MTIALGFVWFTAQALRGAPPPPAADGIVVLTGGADRVREGLDLWRAGRAPALLISGVPEDVSLSAIFTAAGLPPGQDAPAITLGRQAVDTEGNARETAAWVRAHGLRSLIVVTASYHMKRAILEMQRRLPDVTLFADPVLPPALRGQARLGTLRLIASEYAKYLLAWTGVRSPSS